MKTLFIIILFAIGSYARSFAQKITFNNIEIQGSLENFTQKLIENDYVLVSHGKHINLLKGYFLNKYCTVAIVENNKKEIVSVTVDFDEIDDDWKILKERFLTLHNYYLRKYKLPYAEHKSFVYPFVEGFGNEMIGVQNEKCNYVSMWKKKKILVVVKIVKSKTIRIIYSNQKHLKQLQKDLQIEVEKQI